MKMLFSRSVRFALFLAGSLLSPLMAGAHQVDLIVTNANIATLDAAGSHAQALAVQDGRIVAVGKSAELKKLAGPRTKVIDAGGRALVPGLIDSHMHAVRAALSYSTEVNWIGTHTIAEAMSRLSDAARRAKPGGWLIVAGGWTEQQFAEGRRPTLAEILAAAPDNPAYIQLFYRAVLMTPKAQEALAIKTDALPNRISIERDAAGAATGWLAGDIVSISALFDRLPKPSYEENLAGTKQFFTELNRLGITGVSDPGGFSIAPSQYAALFQVWREKALTVRVAYSIFSQNVGAESEEYRTLTQLLPMGFGDDMLHFNGIGERITAAMYNNHNPDEAAKEKLYEIILWAAKQKLTSTIHWQEDRSVGHLLDLFERVNRLAPITDLRWSIAHLEDASIETLRRMKALGVGWTMQDALYFQGDAVLAKRGAATRHIPPVMTALRAGVHVGAGTDAHRVASYNPFVALQWLLDGKTVTGKETRGADETPTREEALRLYTLSSAWFSFDEKKRGSLEVGKLADFAILNRDFFKIAVDKIGGTESLLTVVGGKVVYAAPPFAAFK